MPDSGILRPMKPVETTGRRPSGGVPRRVPARLLPLLGLVACGGGSSSGTFGGAFLLLETEPANNARIFLNESVRFRFSNPVDVDTANFNSIPFFVSDQTGPLSEQVVGRFRHGTDENGKTDPHVLEFVPRLPSNDSYSNGGFRPGRTYVVSLIGSTNSAAPTVRDRDGRRLSSASAIQSVRLRTVSGRTPQELFVDTKAGGPRVLSVDVVPDAGGRIDLNHFGTAPVEVTLRFDQPLNPHSENMPVQQDLDPRKRAKRARGRTRLEYDDPELGQHRWIPADLELAENDATGATVVLRPDGILPNDATVRVIVAPELEDITGESNVNSPRYQPVVAQFRTRQAPASQFDAVVLDFETTELLDPEARFRDPVALVKDGVIQASFGFDGDDVPFDFDPTTKSLILNTDATQVPIRNGPPLFVTGGVFRFRDVEIDEGITVSGTGTNPLVILAAGRVRIDGTLSVNGGDGTFANTFGSANIPRAGGVGVCTGGGGGRASQGTTASTQQAEPGLGPLNRPGGGGTGGRLACGVNRNNGFGSGGGGGSHATFGDPDFFPQDPRADGHGGDGTSPSGTVPGGRRGPKIFTDKDDANDFWGRGIDANGNPIRGELASPIGGAGGGGGGDRTFGTTSAPCQGQPFFNDFQGGGGGAGAGVIVIQALGPIIVGPSGRISADGGNGAGGYFLGNSSHAGGGGAGAGGMVVLMSATGIDVHMHGGRWKEGDTNFSITADGGFSRSTGRPTKYSNGFLGPNVGGFGGMGLVQLMTPPGRDRDRTGTVQDDNVRVLNASGEPVDGVTKTNTLFGGDLRPDPKLLPTPFSRFSQAQTRWISTGATVRRSVPSIPAGARSLLQPAKPGPEYSFAGLRTTGDAAGYLDTDPRTGRYHAPVVGFAGEQRLPVIASRSNAGHEPGGLLVHEVELAASPLPGDGRLAHHRARGLGKAGNVVGEWRILRHTDRLLRLDARDGPMPARIASVEILAKFFGVFTEGNEGLGLVYEVKERGETLRFPVANVQLGFAFHKDPALPDLVGSKDTHRWPQELDTFLHDLQTPAAQATLRDLHYPFLKIQIRFNLNYDHNDPSTNRGPAPVSTRSQRPALRFLLVPFRY